MMNTFFVEKLPLLLDEEQGLHFSVRTRKEGSSLVFWPTFQEIYVDIDVHYLIKTCCWDLTTATMHCFSLFLCLFVWIENTAWIGLTQ
jgi:hypothetical protein